MPNRSTQARVLALAAMAALLLVPATAAAHANLDVPTPMDGATVDGSPPEVSGTFIEAIKPDGSSLVLRDTNNAVVARGGPDPNDDHRMVITELPELAIGSYEVEWTTISADDGELVRGTWSFTVATGLKSPGMPAPSGTAAPSPTGAPSASQGATTALSPTPTTPANASGDVVLPIIVALAIVLIGAGLLLSRRRRPSGGM